MKKHFLLIFVISFALNLSAQIGYYGGTKTPLGMSTGYYLENRVGFVLNWAFSLDCLNGNNYFYEIHNGQITGVGNAYSFSKLSQEYKRLQFELAPVLLIAGDPSYFSVHGYAGLGLGAIEHLYKYEQYVFNVYDKIVYIRDCDEPGLWPSLTWSAGVIFNISPVIISIGLSSIFSTRNETQLNFGIAFTLY